ncbi:MAG: hypothetical protein JEY96_01580 [Bacteroidales bacterium]|nr:hypothetical protein [Bacteroidales bacterium]
MKKKFLAIINSLGYGDKITNKTMEDADWEKVNAEFKKQHGVDFTQALADSEKLTALEQSHKDAAYALAEGKEEVKPGKETTAEEKPKKETLATEDVNLAEEIKKLNTKNKELEGKVEKLEQEPEEVKLEKVNTEKLDLGFLGAKTTATHLFGIEHENFARTKWYNEMAATRTVVDPKKNQIKAFRSDFDSYGESLAGRYAHLHQENMLVGMTVKEVMAGSIDYSDLEGSLGSQYSVRRQDALISYLRQLPTVTSIFPLRSNVQDKEDLVNLFMTNFSQAYQSGKVWKGDFEIKPEQAEMFGVMFKHKFSDLKALEKQYIGYLNREGSNPIKWTFIEYLFVELFKGLHNEQEQRRVMGCRVEPTTDEAGHHMFGSDGVVYKLFKYEENLQILPFEMGPYSQSTIVSYIESFIESVSDVIDNIEGWKLNINKKHIPWYKKKYRELYGTDGDFKGTEMKAIDYTEETFVPIPNMPKNCFKMWITLPGNIELMEDKPGEMLEIYFQQDMEELLTGSWWKEGSAAYLSGKKFATRAELIASDREFQFVFTNDAVTTIAADATTADAANNIFFKTSANTQATVLTDISNAKEGVVYKIECGATANASTITKENKFSEISATWTPTAVGDFIKVYYNKTTAKFHEVARIVTA